MLGVLDLRGFSYFTNTFYWEQRKVVREYM